MVTRMFARKNADGAFDQSLSADLLRIELEDKPFNFYAVDGGTVNNEPFGEVIKALEAKLKNPKEKNYAILMIDPFPNFEKEAEPDIKKRPTLLDLAPMVIGAIRGQAMIKESDLVEGLTSDHTLRMIFPSRRFINEQGEKEKDPYPISCGALDGFGGFFSRDFREHDFLLGRKNCQSFLRNYFCIPIERAQKMSVFEDWEAGDERHQRFFSPDVNGYPIIPDMTYYPDDYKKEMASEFEVYTLSNPEKHTIDAEQIIALKDRIHHRLKTVLLNLTKKSEAAPKEAAPVKVDPAAKEYTRQIAEVDALMEKHFKQSAFQAFVSQVAINIGKQLWKKPIADKAAAYLTQMVIRTILVDFKTRGLLSEQKKK